VTSDTVGAGPAAWSRRFFFIACALAPFVRPAKAEGASVEIHHFRFSPAEIEIAAGNTVSFTNLDLVPHTATGDGFDTGTLKKGESKEITFSEAGEFPYLCTLHRHMTGRIRVR
jgi:plastocyanin